jgi:pyruvate/2-oxoglutarate/acetoin dehydrogenase E1 component
MIDRYALLGVKQKFEIGPTLTEPGRARIIQPGGDMQIISYGPMTRRIKAAVKELGMENRIGHIDMLSLRPFPEKDVLEFLSQSNGPILMAHEEPADRGVGGNIIQTIFDMDSPYAEFTIGRKRKSSKLAATRAPLSTDKRMMYEQLPSQDRIKKKITRMLAA